MPTLAEKLERQEAAAAARARTRGQGRPRELDRLPIKDLRWRLLHHQDPPPPAPPATDPILGGSSAAPVSRPGPAGDIAPGDPPTPHEAPMARSTCILCHERPSSVRGLCGRCYDHHQQRGTLDEVAAPQRRRGGRQTSIPRATAPDRAAWTRLRLDAPPGILGRRAFGGAMSGRNSTFGVLSERVEAGRQWMMIETPYPDKVAQRAREKGWTCAAVAPTNVAPAPAQEPPEASAPVPMLTDAPVPTAAPEPATAVEEDVEVYDDPPTPPAPDVEELRERAAPLIDRAFALAEAITEIDRLVSEEIDDPSANTLEKVRALLGRVSLLREMLASRDRQLHAFERALEVHRAACRSIHAVLDMADAIGRAG